MRGVVPAREVDMVRWDVDPNIRRVDVQVQYSPVASVRRRAHELKQDVGDYPRRQALATDQSPRYRFQARRVDSSRRLAWDDDVHCDTAQVGDAPQV